VPSSLSAAGRGRGDGRFHLPRSNKIDCEQLVKFCPFVLPSLQSSALRITASAASNVDDSFRDLALSVADFLDFRVSLKPRNRGLSCLVVVFERETPTTRLGKVFSVVRPCVVDLGVTAGFLPRDSTVRTGRSFSSTDGTPSLVVFRTNHPRGEKFRESAQFQAASRRSQDSPTAFFKVASPGLNATTETAGSKPCATS